MTESYDYIVIGSGAAGSIVAERLTRDPSHRVLLVEAGERSRSPLLQIPAAETWLMGKTNYDWSFQTDPDPTLDGRALTIPRGRVLGGSTAINGMLFVRGQAADFNDWEAAGCPGWSWQDVLPAYRRLERSGISGPSRGEHGRISVNEPREHHTLVDAFIRAAANKGFTVGNDYNSGHQNGFGYYQVNHWAGKRSSPLTEHLLPAMRRKNLNVLTKHHAHRLVIQAGRAVGIEVQANSETTRYKCEREIVLSAGVAGSPAILERSGIGQPSLLRALGIPVVHELPGVGENLQDHFAVRVRWRVQKPITFNEASRGIHLLHALRKYALNRKGFLSLPIALGYGFVSVDGSVRPDTQFHFSPATYGAGPTRRLERQPGMTIGIYPLRPLARGSIHIRSRDPRIAPSIRTNFLEHQQDIEILIKGVELARTLVSDQAFDEYRGQELLPGADISDRITLTQFARSSGDTSYHPVGTCRMGQDNHAVVEPDLRLRGIGGVRVIDASVMPSLVSGNTQAASMLIGEIGAELLTASG